MKCEGKVEKGITRAPGLGMLTRYGARVVFKAAAILLSGLLIIIVLSRWGQTRTTSTIITSNREAGMKVNAIFGLNIKVPGQEIGFNRY